MRLAISVNQPERCILIRNHQNSRVQSLLQRVASFPNCSEAFRGRISRILSGDAWSAIERFQNDCGYQRKSPAMAVSDSDQEWRALFLPFYVYFHSGYRFATAPGGVGSLSST